MEGHVFVFSLITEGATEKVCNSFKALERKWLSETNTLAYYSPEFILVLNSFMILLSLVVFTK